MTRLFLLFTISALLLSAETFTGVITDGMCGKDHRAMNMGPEPECIKACAKTSKYVLFDGKKMYKLSDQATPERFAAQRVKVSGTLFEKTGIIKVDHIEAANR
ncbi:MAG TPA: hypothetical protein VKU01_27110 [Bryobacteraceae bacterium]|nr:hypothetical protein [Bryobacteraceae bacterium]